MLWYFIFVDYLNMCAQTLKSARGNQKAIDWKQKKTKKKHINRRTWSKTSRHTHQSTNNTADISPICAQTIYYKDSNMQWIYLNTKHLQYAFNISLAVYVRACVCLQCMHVAFRCIVFYKYIGIDKYWYIYVYMNAFMTQQWQWSCRAMPWGSLYQTQVDFMSLMVCHRLGWNNYAAVSCIIYIYTRRRTATANERRIKGEKKAIQQITTTTATTFLLSRDKSSRYLFALLCRHM